jgi:peptide/nickel transport system permease protein
VIGGTAAASQPARGDDAAGAVRRRRRRNGPVARAVGLAAALLVVALLLPAIAPYDPIALGDLGPTAYRPPSAAHMFGTDAFGRDVLSRVLWGARVSLAIGALSALLATTLGATVGLAAGMRGGRTDSVLMRGVDLMLAIPRTFLVVLIAGLLRPSLPVLVIVLGITAWMGTARIVRVHVRALAGADFIAAARSAGIPAWRIVVRHMLPHIATPLLVSASVMVGQTILAENALSFLGFGVQVPTPSWGGMVQEGRSVFPAVWWVSLFPGLALTLTVLACNFLGDTLRDALDPRHANRGVAS